MNRFRILGRAVGAIGSGIGMIGGAWLDGGTVNPTMLAGIAVITVGVTILATGRSPP